MNSVKIITENVRQIYPYNKKGNVSQHSEKNNNKTEENRKPLTQRLVSHHLFIDDSLSRLREYIKTPKPFIVSKPIRKKMKYIKMVKNRELDNFYVSSLKASSARFTENKYNKNQMKTEAFSVNGKKLNKSKKLKINIEELFSDFKNNKLNKSQQYNKNKINSSKKFISSMSNIKTNFSSMPIEEISKGNNIKYIYSYNHKKMSEDSFGYKNYYVKDPCFSEIGVIKDFMKKVDNLRKNAYKNYYLKLNEFQTNILYENKLSQIQLNNRNHNITKYYLDKYNNGFNIYWYKLNQELKEETENIDNLQYKLKEIKMEISKLSNKIQKKLIKIIDIVIIRKYFEELKYFSSFKVGTPYYRLLECKNEIMKTVKDYEQKTNYIRYILNDKDLGIYSFIENNKEIFNNKDIKNIIISQINEIKDVPSIINMNIKSLLMEEHFLEKNIDSLNYKLLELINNSKENKYYETLNLNEINYCIKRLAQIKTDNEFLEYKNEKMKKQNQNDIFGNLSKNIRLKILQIIKNLNKNNYITEDENNNLYEIFKKNKIKYFLECMYVIEKKVNLLNKFKEEVINKNEELSQIYKYSCRIEEAKRKKLKEIKEKMIKEQNVIDRLNKTKYINDTKKDFFKVNRIIYLKSQEKIKKKKKKEKEKNNKKNEIYPTFKTLMKII